MPQTPKDPYHRKQRIWNLQSDIALTIDYAVKNPPNIARAEGWLSAVVAALEKKNGDLDAFELMLNH